MDNIDEMVENLYVKDTTVAYSALKLLEEESQHSDSVYSFFDRLAQMIDSDNSYIRTRGLILISANAKWDTGNKINKIIDNFLKHILDEKPITSRQCIKVLPNIAKYKPELSGTIRKALMDADVSIYNDNMSPLIQKDILSALKKIK